MGIAYDPNEVLKIPSYKQQQTEKVVAIGVKNGDFTVTEEEDMTPSLPSKASVVRELEADAKAPREASLRYCIIMYVLL